MDNTKKINDDPNEDYRIINNLSREEQEYLKTINDKSNKIRNKIARDNDILQNNIYTLLNNWSKSLKDILDDIVHIELSLNKDDQYWWKEILEFTNKIYFIFTKNDRKIYVGITLIIVSFLLYIIDITS